MHVFIRRERRPSSLLVRSLLAGGGLLALTTAPAAEPPRVDEPGQGPSIVVNSGAGSARPVDGSTTLAEALIQAARDPRDNLIRFDAAALGRKPLTITLESPISVPARRCGHDVIDGSAIPGGVVLDASACPDAAVVIGGDGTVTLRHVTVQGGAQRAVLVKQGGRLRLEQVLIRQSSGPGVALFGGSNASIVHCRIMENGTHGVELHHAATAQLDDVALVRNRQSAVAAFDESSLTARDCRLETEAEWNVVLTHAAQARLTKCELKGATFADADLSGSAQARFDACTLEKGARFGVFATGEAAVELSDTRVSGHAGRGLELQDNASVTLTNSRVESSGDYGVILFGRARLTAVSSVIADHAAHGASLRGQATGEFRECQFIGNRYSGIGCPDDQDGGRVRVTRCTFHGNGMRPIYRGPVHIDPMIPTPLRIDGPSVTCLAAPHAAVELFFDRAGEAMHYVQTVHADEHGRFRVDCRTVPEGWVMSASATSGGATSEFNVVAGTTAEPVISALLGRTGPLSDSGAGLNRDVLLRRWKRGTHIVFEVDQAPSLSIERYMRFLVPRIEDWTGGAMTAEARFGDRSRPADAVAIPVRYVPADAPALVGRGGVAFMKWDAAGFFLSPMEITLAIAEEPRETCPRVLAHEVGHALGLCHARVGLLSRMQGSVPCSQAFVNDFSPMMTYYDVLALQTLHDLRNGDGTLLRDVLERGTPPGTRGPALVTTGIRSRQPTFSPPASNPREPQRNLPAPR